MRQLLTVDEVASLLQVPKKTLYQWKYRGEGPPAVKIGRHLRYDEKELEKWVQSQAS